MPEWYLLILALSATSALGAAFHPFLLALPLLTVVLGAAVADAAFSTRRACAPLRGRGHRRGRVRAYALTLALHLLQPAARLQGRLTMGLTLWRRRGTAGLRLPRPHERTLWSERWRAVEDRLADIESTLNDDGAVTRRGGPYDRWDLQIRGGITADARLRVAVEEHGAGRQLVRFRIWPRWRPSRSPSSPPRPRSPPASPPPPRSCSSSAAPSSPWRRTRPPSPSAPPPAPAPRSPGPPRATAARSPARRPSRAPPRRPTNRRRREGRRPAVPAPPA